ncbi:MAG: cytochrome c/FTR1 family iron permease [Nitrospinae bacterium]|nr:cytochrome c/FTR1 family iron permease [Nitrospinota bacterium]
MMLNIVVKEYNEGISGGAVINGAEYEESLVFLEQAFSRYKSVAPASPDLAIAKEISDQFEALGQGAKNKKEPAEIRKMTKVIQSSLLNAFGVRIDILPDRRVSLEEGKKIYETNCAACHGAEGKGDGPLAAQLNPRPAVLADPRITGDAETEAYDNFQIVNVGIGGTAMKGWADDLSEMEIWNVAYYIRTFSNARVKLPDVPATGTAPAASAESAKKKTERAFAEIRGLLDRSLAAFKSQNAAAAEQAFDAYLAYETLESGLIAKDKSLGLRLESSFGRYRAEIKRGATPSLVEGIHDSIKKDLAEAQDVLTEKIGFAGLFVQSLSIIVREGFEAILVVAALIAFLVKSRNQDKLKSIYGGVLAGVAASFLTAYILHEILNVSVSSQELLEGWIMLVAVAVLFWVSYWLVSKIEARKWQSYITGKMRQAVSGGSAFTLGAVAFLSVYREGFETVLFYKALYTYAGENGDGIMPGFLVGGLCLAVVYYLIAKVGLRIPVRWFFTITSVFLYYMAFTFMGKGLHELQMGRVVSMTPALFIPQVSWLGIYPTWETFAGQGLLVAAYVFALLYTFGIKPEIESKTLKAETRDIQKDISMVHDLVEHISHHAKRCEIFLKDTRDQDLKELSEHLKEIDQKVHELSDHVRYVENQLLDEYDRLGRAIAEKGNP